MTETRRDVFKTSVVSAFGLMSVGALTGCKEKVAGNDKGQKGRVDLDATDTVILGWNENKDNAAPLPTEPAWYVFHKADTVWEVYVYSGSLSDPFTLYTGAFDTYGWYSANKLALTQVKNKFKFTNSGNLATFKFSGNYLDADSSAYLVQLGQATRYFTQATWNEIGKS